MRAPVRLPERVEDDFPLMLGDTDARILDPEVQRVAIAGLHAYRDTTGLREFQRVGNEVLEYLAESLSIGVRLLGHPLSDARVEFQSLALREQAEGPGHLIDHPRNGERLR